MNILLVTRLLSVEKPTSVCEDIRSRYFNYPLPPKDADFRPQQELQATGLGTQGARFLTYQSLLSTGNVTLRPL